jgi:transposase-like protein
MYAELERKMCSKCKHEKPAKDFYKVAGGLRLRPECKSCTNLYHKKYRSTEYGKIATKKARDTYMSSPDNVLKDKQNKSEWARFKKYGLVKSDYNRMLEMQSFKCKICGKEHSNTKLGLVVDHDHVTGEVRGLLCDGCNRGLGFFGDSERALELAAVYLRSSRSRG